MLEWDKSLSKKKKKEKKAQAYVVIGYLQRVVMQTGVMIKQKNKVFLRHVIPPPPSPTPTPISHQQQKEKKGHAWLIFGKIMSSGIAVIPRMFTSAAV